MPLFPQSFIDDVRLQADIVQVVQDHVPLRKSGATYKGLCPFHGEKTPSFHVNREKGFFHCFGCGVGGDVIKFVELHEKASFTDAVRMLATRFGLAIPVAPEDAGGGTTTAEREALLKVHEVAAEWFRMQLLTPAATRVRKQLTDRGMTEKTIAELRFGSAPNPRGSLKPHLRPRGCELPLLFRRGLVRQRDSGDVVDRFRGRL